MLLTSKTNGVSDPSISLCTTHVHEKLICKLPPGQGTNYELSLIVFGQTPSVGTWKNINYETPVVTKVTPEQASTLNPGIITIAGNNFGVMKPVVTLVGTNKNCTVISHTHIEIKCQVANGEGKNHQVVVIAGGQSSSITGPTFSYIEPSITSFAPKNGRTDALNATLNGRQVMVLNGFNFGTPENNEFSIVFNSIGEIDALGNPSQFTVPPIDILIRTHEQITFYQPPGYGANVKITILVKDQISTPSTAPFVYETPTFNKARPKCEMKISETKYETVQCYGYNLPGE